MESLFGVRFKAALGHPLALSRLKSEQVKISIFFISPLLTRSESRRVTYGLWDNN